MQQKRGGSPEQCSCHRRWGGRPANGERSKIAERLDSCRTGRTEAGPGGPKTGRGHSNPAPPDWDRRGVLPEREATIGIVGTRAHDEEQEEADNESQDREGGNALCVLVRRGSGEAVEEGVYLRERKAGRERAGRGRGKSL